MSNDDRFEPVEIEVDRVERVTDKAMLCVIDGESHWIPLSQISETDCEDRNDSGYIVIPMWLAEEKELA